ncbi:MAG: sugar phosphate isomerase/epimerase family protein [Alphaproteobacteria bacterium]
MTNNNDYKFSLAHLCAVDQPILNLMQLAESAGYDYVSPRLLPVTDTETPHVLVGNKEKIKECQKFLEDSPLEVLDIELLKITADTNVTDDFEPVLEAGKYIDAKHAITQVYVDGDDIPYDKIEKLCELADSYNMNIVLEMIPWSNLSSVDKTVEVLNSLKGKNTGILLDLLHLFRTDTSKDDLKNIPEQYCHFVHLCDGTAPWHFDENSQKHIARGGRYPAGRGDIPVMDYLKLIPSNVYSLEIPNERLYREMGGRKYAKFILEDTKNYLSLSSCWSVKDEFYSVPTRLI